MRSFLLCVLALLLVRPAIAQPVAVDTLLSPDPQPFLGFGFSTAAIETADGTLWVLSLEAARSPEGAAYLFRKEVAGGSWTYAATLGSISDPGRLGFTEVALSAGLDAPLAVLTDGGEVALWRLQPGDTWTPEALLMPEEPCCDNPYFGSGLGSTALTSGEELVMVGAERGGDNPKFPEGSVYAFVRAPGSPDWVREARIVNPDPNGAGDEFGASVAVVSLGEVPGTHPGDALVLVGVPRNDIAALSSGAAYVLRRDGATATWSVEALLVSPDAGGQNVFEFGYAVALAPVPDGTPGAAPGEAVALVGAPSGSSFLCGASAGGAAYAFHRRPDPDKPSGYTWTAERLFCADTPTVDHRFGSAVALAPAPEPAVPGAPRPLRALIGTDPISGSDGHPGEAVLFRRTVNGQTEEPSWAERAAYASGTVGTFSADWFGHAVALAGDYAFVGAYFSDAAQSQGFPEAEGAGAVYVYDAATTVENHPPSPDGFLEGLALSVHPNPVRGRAEVRFETAHPGPVRIVIYDVLGRAVLIQNAGDFVPGRHRLSLDLAVLAPGSYLVAVLAPDGTRRARTVTVLD